MTEPQTLLAEASGEGVLLIRLNRPEKRNALATSLLLEFARTLDRAAADKSVRVVTGNEKVFAAGADLDELALSGDTDPIKSDRFLAWKAVRGFPKPLLAAVEGWCLGAESKLMLCCDIVVAGVSAMIGQPETNLGIMPGAGGTATLTRLVGRALPMHMVLTGEPIDAGTARSAGLIARLAPDGEALEQALAIARRLASRAPLALQAAKASVRQAAESFKGDHLVAERERFVTLLGSADKQAGIAAFREKRPARWTGA